MKFEWEKSVRLTSDAIEEIRELKGQDGPALQVQGSGNFIQTLLTHDLIDELWLKTFPVTLATRKHVFAEGAIPGAFTLRTSKTAPSGVIVASFKRAGEVKTGAVTP